jgi:uncharacterized repeat protein (TIGR04138 family)
LSKPRTKSSTPDWTFIRARGNAIPPVAFDFVRDGLSHTVAKLHGNKDDTAVAQRTESRHVNGRDLCLGLRDLAVRRYGLLAPTVLRSWGVRTTADFGVIVYTLIDRQELKPSDDDRFDDFVDVYQFDEAFAPEQALV